MNIIQSLDTKGLSWSLRTSLLVTLFWVVSAWPAMATHIVGGSISYRWVGDDQYEITVRVYRDCFNADPGADFDDPASIGIFDRAGLLVTELQVPFVREDTVTNIPSECLVIPGNVCVNTTTYVTTVTLPFKEGGYQIVYQRCCRNETLQNIVEPLETGATYDIWLTEAAMQKQNSSPVFQEWPPIFICVDEPLNFDHSAIDSDGDSLVYKLVMPLQGGTFAESMPQPPNPPPYDEVVLIDPTYSVDNFLGFGDPLSISPDEGQMTVTPGIFGQFVVGVAVEEYDRQTGELLSVSRRDFQYNVVQCVPFEASFAAPDALCDEFTVQLDNQTTGATSFLWNITGADTSFSTTERSPEVTFPDTGWYKVALVVDPGYVCESSFDKDIFVQTNSLEADFRIDILACDDSAYLFLTDQSVDTISNPAAWEWMITPDGTAPFSVSGQFPVVPVPAFGQGTVQLNVTSEYNCQSSLTLPYPAPGGNLLDYLTDTIYACIGAQLVLNAATPTDVQLAYLWQGPGLTDTTAINPLLTVLSGTNTYRLTISGPPGSCLLLADVVVVGIENPVLDFSSQTNCDGLSYHFQDLSTNAVAAEWVIGDLSAPLFTSTETSFDYRFPEAGTYPIYLISHGGCPDTLLRRVEIQPGERDPNIYVVNPGAFPVEISTMMEASSYTWTDATGQVIGNEASVTVSLDCEADYYLQLTDVYGCVQTDSIRVANPLIEVAVSPVSPIRLCVGDEAQLQVENLKACDTLSFNWLPDSYLVSGGNTPNPVFTFTTEGEYQSIGLVSNQFGTTDTILVDFKVGELEIGNLNSPLQGCIGEAFALYPDADTSLTYQWEPADLLSDPTAPNPLTAPIYQDTTFLVTTTLPGTSCKSVDTVRVDVRDDIILDISADPGFTVCPQSTVTLRAMLEEGAIIAWLDPAGNLLGATDTLEIAMKDQTIEIRVLARDPNGCEQVQTIRLVPRDVALGLNNQIEACAQIPIALNPGGNPAYTYVWSPVEGLDDPLSFNPIYDASQAQVFSVTVTDPVTGCVLTDSVQVQIKEHPSITLTSNDTLLCVPETIELMAASNQPTALNWFADAAMTLPLGSGERITVLPAEGLNQYYVTTGDESCIDERDRVAIEVAVVDFTAVAPDTFLSICKDEPVSLNPRGDDRFMYAWLPIEGLDDPGSPDPIFSGANDEDFTITITSPDGACTVERSQKVRLLSPIHLEAGMDTLLCREGSFTLTAMHNEGFNLVWSTDRNFAGMVTGSDPYTIELEDGGRYYYLRADNGLGCIEVDSVLVGSALIEATLPDEVLTCDASVRASITVNNVQAYQELSYLWLPEEQLASDPLTGPTATLLPGETGLLTVMLENQYACTAELSTRVRLEDVGSAYLLPADTTIDGGRPVEIAVFDCVDCQYQWSPDADINNPNAEMIRVTPLETTQYAVNLSKAGCERVLYSNITVDGVLCTTDNIFIPNTFTPNGDNQNDLLLVRSNVIESLHFVIYNRWGQEVFDTRDQDVGWDGTFRGNDLPPDVYGYYLTAICFDGSELTLQGNVTLLR